MRARCGRRVDVVPLAGVFCGAVGDRCAASRIQLVAREAAARRARKVQLRAALLARPTAVPPAARHGAVAHRGRRRAFASVPAASRPSGIERRAASASTMKPERRASWFSGLRRRRARRRTERGKTLSSAFATAGRRFNAAMARRARRQKASKLPRRRESAPNKCGDRAERAAGGTCSAASTSAGGTARHRTDVAGPPPSVPAASARHRPRRSRRDRDTILISDRGAIATSPVDAPGSRRRAFSLVAFFFCSRLFVATCAALASCVCRAPASVCVCVSASVRSSACVCVCLDVCHRTARRCDFRDALARRAQRRSTAVFARTLKKHACAEVILAHLRTPARAPPRRSFRRAPSVSVVVERLCRSSSKPDPAPRRVDRRCAELGSIGSPARAPEPRRRGGGACGTSSPGRLAARASTKAEEARAGASCQLALAVEVARRDPSVRPSASPRGKSREELRAPRKACPCRALAGRGVLGGARRAVHRRRTPMQPRSAAAGAGAAPWDRVASFARVLDRALPRRWRRRSSSEAPRCAAKLERAPFTFHGDVGDSASAHVTVAIARLLRVHLIARRRLRRIGSHFGAERRAAGVRPYSRVELRTRAPTPVDARGGAARGAVKRITGAGAAWAGAGPLRAQPIAVDRRLPRRLPRILEPREHATTVGSSSSPAQRWRGAGALWGDRASPRTPFDDGDPPRRAAPRTARANPSARRLGRSKPPAQRRRAAAACDLRSVHRVECRAAPPRARRRARSRCDGSPAACRARCVASSGWPSGPREPARAPGGSVPPPGASGGARTAARAPRERQRGARQVCRAWIGGIVAPRTALATRALRLQSIARRALVDRAGTRMLKTEPAPGAAPLLPEPAEPASPWRVAR